jgi:Domain of unknown function (DUF4169)
MDSIINLRRARKRKAREITSKEAAANRIKSGRSRAEREVTDRIHAIEDRRLNAHLRQVRAADDGE